MSKYEKVDGHSNLYLDTRTGVYYWRESIQGRRLFKSTGQRTKGRALTEIKRLRKLHALGEFEETRYTFSQAFDAAMELKKKRSKKTHSEAEQGERRLKEFFVKHCKFLDMFERDYESKWSQYKDFAYARNLKNLGRKGKLNHDRKYLCYVLGRARNRGWMKRVIQARDLPLDSVVRHTGRALTDDEVLKLLKEAKEIHSDLHLQILIGVTMGMRKGEILGLDKDEIDLEQGVLNPLAERIKTRIERKIPIPISEDAFPYLKKLYHEREGSKIFPSPVKKGEAISELPRAWDTIREKTGIVCQFKDLRTTCATNMVASGIPFLTISKVLGHSIKMLNDIYDRLNQETKEKVQGIFKGRFERD